MICANCKSDKCPAPAGEETYIECGNGYGVVTIGDRPRPVVVNEWQERAQKAEAEVATLRGAIAAQDARDLAACERVGIPPQGCDTSDQLADEVLGLKAELAELLPLWPHCDHGPRCKAPFDQRAECTCPAYEANAAREKALKLVTTATNRTGENPAEPRQ